MIGRIAFIFLFSLPLLASGQQRVHTVAADAWGNNSVNAVIFRKNSIVSLNDTQYIAYYNADRYMVLGKRSLKDTVWQLKRTPYKGNAADAHNSISIMVDGKGTLHVSWDHHGNKLHYAKGTAPGSLELTPEIPMTGFAENKVTYPEFYRMANGNLLFFFREGQSGQGNLVMNTYDIQTEKWTTIQQKLIDGEGQRNAYWQAFVDAKGTIHVSWVWRESADVASNHDLCYARSRDGGHTWEKTNGAQYTLPINAASAEYAWRIPQKSELINQTSMNADGNGNPYIATYWRDVDSNIPQYRIVHFSGKKWEMNNTGFRTTPFSLSGVGTKSIPISRPQLLITGKKKSKTIYLLFRDAERAEKPSMAWYGKSAKNKWRITDLSMQPVGAWEPSFDTELWKKEQLLHLFLQKVVQIDGEGKANIPPQEVQVLECNPKKLTRL